MYGFKRIWLERHKGVKMWTFGYTEWDLANKNDTSKDPCVVPIDVVLGEEKTFPQAISELLKWVQIQLNEAEMYETECWQRLESDIREIHDDDGIMGDKDMWEDQTFYDIYDTEYYIQQI